MKKLFAAARESAVGTWRLSLRCEGSDAIGAKRTCRERRERVDLTKMTPTRHWGAAEKHRHSALPEREDRTLAACYRSFH
jgi:hypothetical protein